MSIQQNPVYALIPARSGSKGLQRKNMISVKGIPLVGYSIRAALGSKYIKKVFLSSDDEAILNYAKEEGAIPIQRPYKFSTDSASANGVVEHFFEHLPSSIIKKNPYVVYLQPTSPLRTSFHIDEALIEMKNKNLNKLISVSLMKKSPFKSFIITSSGVLKALFNEEMTNSRRQDIPKTYLPNGAIYVFSYKDFKEKNAFPSDGSYPYVMNEQDSLDIDTKEDLAIFKNIMNS